MSSLINKNKNKGTVIHRTTSETLRLGDDIQNNSVRMVLPTTTSQRKKNSASSPNCSFQIIGVTRYDHGDDSADDLDESHTDDISRITDNETPSFSEDSRDIDEPQQIFTNPPSSVVQQHHHPESIVEEVGTETESIVEEVTQKVGRFTVTKIKTAMPVSRGRWTCLDYKDLPDPSYILCDNQNIAPAATIAANARLWEALNKNNAGDVKKTSFTQNNCQETNSDSGAIQTSNTTNIFPIDIKTLDAVGFLPFIGTVDTSSAQIKIHRNDDQVININF